LRLSPSCGRIWNICKRRGPSLIGFGRHHYRYESGREGDTPLAGFSPRKAATVLYGVTGFTGSDALLAKLGKHATGKGCLYIKKLAGVDLKVLEALASKSVAAQPESSISGTGYETPKSIELEGLGVW
jgi:predicted GIY-YIG superfamily endonuclease